MKEPLLNIILSIATFMEGFAILMASCGYLWILLLPSHITHHQKDVMVIVSKIIGFALIVAWAVGFSFFLSFLKREKTANNVLTKLKWWMILLTIINIILTIAFMIGGKTISVSGPA